MRLLANLYRKGLMIEMLQLFLLPLWRGSLKIGNLGLGGGGFRFCDSEANLGCCSAGCGTAWEF